MFSHMTRLLAEAHQDMLLQEADNHRAARFGKLGNPRFRERILAQAGDFLIFAGLWLRERYTTPVCTAAEVCPPAARKVRI
jgi:hypothetical protein